MDELMHIYAQDSWHQPATIVGNRAALERLVETIQSALDTGQGSTFELETFANDGEGYEVRVMVINDTDMWAQIATPYTDEMCQGTNAGKVYP